MDVYGFYGAGCPYQYNQSDELAKQMFAQQALATSVPFPQEPGASNMMVPSGTPWNSRGLPWGLQSPPQLVQFTGQTPFKNESGPILHCKRKSLDVEPAIPAKQHITEEKMAAHLNSLHISSNYTAHSANEFMDVSMDGTRDTEAVTEKLKGHTIVLSEEVKRIREEPLLPAVLMERLEKPSMSLVVWKPRENIINQIKEKESKTEVDITKRNGVLIADNNKDIEMYLENGPQWCKMNE